MGKLTAAFVKQTTKVGRHGDGRGGYGLALMVRERKDGGVAKRWIQQVRAGTKMRTFGLGRYPVVGLAEARRKALENVQAMAEGRNPRASDVPTFRQAADEAMQLRMPTWRQGGKSEAQWRSSLETYVHPHIGHMRVDAITSAEVLAVLRPIWHERPETARRVRHRLGAVLAWAVGQRYLTDNPARSDAVTNTLTRQPGRTHHVALPPEEAPNAVATVQASGAWPGTKLCFKFVVLTACRSGEGRNAHWDEIDLDANTWTIPGDRTKTGNPHRVPLSSAALAVLEEARNLPDGGGLVFPSATGKVMSDSTVSKLLRDNDVGSTLHGFRATFRDWCAESGVPWEVSEAAMAHKIRGVAGAYRRVDLLEARRPVMEKWGKHVTDLVP